MKIDSLKDKIWTKTILSIGIVVSIVSILALSSYASAQGTQVEVQRITLAVGSTGKIAVRVKNVTSPDGLGGYNFTIAFDPSVIKVEAVEPGDGPFNIVPVSNTDNRRGSVRFLAVLPAMKGPIGDIVVASLVVAAIGKSGTSTDLTLSINPDGLLDAKGVPLTAAVSFGAVFISGAVESTPTPVTKTPTTPPVPTFTPSRVTTQPTTPLPTKEQPLTSVPTPQVISTPEPMVAPGTPVPSPPAPPLSKGGASCRPREAIISSGSGQTSGIDLAGMSLFIGPFVIALVRQWNRPRARVRR